MKQLITYIKEAKFMNLNDDELKVCDDMLKSIIDNDYDTLTKIDWNDRVSTTSPVYGNKYFVEFNNPFADSHKFSNSNKDNIAPEKEETIQCIGIADKFGRIFLQNVWNKAEAYIQYKKAEKITKKDGSSFTTKPGWYLTRKNANYYRVKGLKEYKKPVFYSPDENVSKDIYNVFIDYKYIIDLNNMNNVVKKTIDKINKEIEAKKAEEIKRKEAEELKTYKFIGCANTWQNDIPDEFKKANDDPGADWFVVNIGHCYNAYYSRKYKIYYTVDSSD